MADNDTAALVVALSAQLTRFERDMKGAVDIADKRTREIENTFTRMNGAINAKLQLLSSSALNNLGFFGTLLTSLGPAGIAAGVGIGATVGVVLALADATAEFADKSKRLKEAAETADLTISRFKLLGSLGKTVGLDFEESAAFFTKFVQNLSALREGSGPLYDALLKIDAGLLRELSTTKDSAKAIDLLVAAFARLDNQTAKLDLARAAGGRAGLTGVRLLESLAKSGGLSGLEANSPKIDEGQIERAAKLKTEIDGIARANRSIFGGLWSDTILEHQKAASLEVQELYKWLEKVVGAKERAARISNPVAANADDLVKEKAELEAWLAKTETTKKVQLEASKIKLKPGEELASLKGWDQQAEAIVGRLKEIDTLLDKIRGANSGALPTAKPEDERPPKPINLRLAREGQSELAPPSKNIEPGSPSVELAILQKHLSLLGDAVTEGEKWRQKQLEIKAAAEKDPTVNGIAGRALAAFNLTMRASALAARERLGIAHEEEIVSVGLAKLQADRARGFIRSDQEMVQAEQILRREAKATAEALQVRASNLPELTRYMIDARNSMKQFDTIAVASLSNAENAFADAVTGTKTLQAAISDLAASAARDFAKMAFRMALSGLIGGGDVGGLFGGLFGGANPVVPGATNVVGIAGSVPVPTFMAGGGDLQPGSRAYVGEHGPHPMLIENVGSKPIMVTPDDIARTSSGGNVSVALSFGDIDARGAAPGVGNEIRDALERYVPAIATKAVREAMLQRRM